MELQPNKRQKVSVATTAFGAYGEDDPTVAHAQCLRGTNIVKLRCAEFCAHDAHFQRHQPNNTVIPSSHQKFWLHHARQQDDQETALAYLTTPQYALTPEVNFTAIVASWTAPATTPITLEKSVSISPKRIEIRVP